MAKLQNIHVKVIALSAQRPAVTTLGGRPRPLYRKTPERCYTTHSSKPPTVRSSARCNGTHKETYTMTDQITGGVLTAF